MTGVPSEPVASGGPPTVEDPYLSAAIRLHRYLLSRHWRDGALVGPDVGVRFNARIGRFLKSYLSFLPWSDDMAYIQAQGYWIMANAALAGRTGGESYRGLVAQGAQFVRHSQVDGHWPYPNPEWGSRVATVEGCFGGLGLLAAHELVHASGALEAAGAWFDYIESTTGFRDQGGSTELAVNYFSFENGRHGGVPNNSTLLLWFLARMWAVTGEEHYLDKSGRLVRWLGKVQLPTGELPYALGEQPGQDRVHFLCHQYNAFEFLDLVHYMRITGDDSVLPILEPLAGFLLSGLDPGGRPAYECGRWWPQVLYYAVAIARALSEAARLDLADSSASARAGFEWALAHQRTDGSFRPYSRGDYKIFRDDRSYPRANSMILAHLVQESEAQQEALP